MGYEERKAWADTFLDQQHRILNSCVNLLDFNKVKNRGVQFIPAPEYDDMHLATDTIVFSNLRIALRVRSGKSSDYGDIAIRSYKPSGAKTEIHKIKEGCGDYYLYCWSIDGVTITEWILIDLDRFRAVMDSCLKIHDFFTYDGSAFNTYSINKLIEHGCCPLICLNLLT